MFPGGMSNFPLPRGDDKNLAGRVLTGKGDMSKDA